MKPEPPSQNDQSGALVINADKVKQSSEEDMLLLLCPIDGAQDYLWPVPRAQPLQIIVLKDRQRTEASNDAQNSYTADRIGVLDDRLKRGPEGLRQRLAQLGADELSFFGGVRIGQTRLVFGMASRQSRLQVDTATLAQIGRVAGRPSSRPGLKVDLFAGLDCQDPEALDKAEHGLGYSSHRCRLHRTFKRCFMIDGPDHSSPIKSAALILPLKEWSF